MDCVYLQLKMKCWTRTIRFRYLFGWVISKVCSKHANMLPDAQLIGTSCKNLSVLCGQRVSLTVNCDYFHWLLATVSNFGVNSGFFTNWSRAHCAIRIRTKDTGRRYFVRVYLWRTVTNTDNRRKFLAHDIVAMRSDTGEGCLAVSWELGSYAPAWIIEITFHCSY